MLYGPTAYPDGDWVQFTILLADQSPGLNGVGRATASIDGGSERPEGARWDVVFDSLSFDEPSEPVYAAMLEARRRLVGEDTLDEPVAAEVSLDEDDDGAAALPVDAAADSASPPVSMAAADEAVYDVDDRTTGAEMVVDDLDGLVESVKPSAPGGGAGAVGGAAWAPEPTGTGVLARPTLAPGWRPEAPAPVPPRPSTGAFAYPRGELPVPPAPPRPELAPDQRVAPAPRPAVSEAAG
jgi:hypothetical protein